MALRNLTQCFGREKSPAEIRALARENFRRIGENFACAIKTAAMTFDELRPHVEFVGNPRSVSPPADREPQSVVVAIGHFGNFELYARFGQFAPGLPVRHHLPRLCASPRSTACCSPCASAPAASFSSGAPTPRA